MNLMTLANDDYQTIVEGPSLMDALSFEFTAKGVQPNPREITGLGSRQSGKRYQQTSKGKKGAAGDGEAPDDPYTGSLSSIARMRVQPGVVATEYPSGGSGAQPDAAGGESQRGV